MYQKILSEIKQDYYQQRFPNDGQRFVAWYLRNIHMRDMNETREDVTDGADDKQIDAIVVDDNTNTIYVIQGKFIGQSSVDGEPLREVLSSWIQLRDLVRLQENCNDRLKRKLGEVAIALEDEYDIVFELITTGKLSPSANDDLATFQARLVEADEFPASLHLIDEEELRVRYDMALDRENPVINHTLCLTNVEHLQTKIAGAKVILAALPLKECLRLPGIKDGTLFQKNVRQSLGLSNRVNKGIKSSIFHSSQDFFFFHNGVTAICNKMEFSEGDKVHLKSLSVVNGCQSLNTILSCSEKVKLLDDAFIMFRFYEIPQRERADKISINTNSQSAVKPRDLRSNDKRVLGLKKSYEQRYPRGYLITKRGEEAPADRDLNLVTDLSELGKCMMSWHSQRPNIAYSESKIFDKYFEQLFKRDYKPEKVHALHAWMHKARERWVKENPLGLNESLLAMRAYAPYHHLYAVSLCFCVANNMQDGNVPNPIKAWENAIQGNVVDRVVDMAGSCLNSALEAAANEPQPGNRVFSPQNWIKTKTCLAGIRAAIRQYFTMLPMMPGGRELKQALEQPLKMENTDFEARWAAD